MIPLKSVYESWDIAGLMGESRTVAAAGDDLERAIYDLRADVSTMPETRAWEGEGHNAADEMFGRADSHARFFDSIANGSSQNGSHVGVAGVLSQAFHTLSSVKERLDSAVKMIELGPLNISDQWVVLINGEEMTQARYEALQRIQKAFQDKLNPLLVELSAADEECARRLQYIAQHYTSARLDPHDIYASDRVSEAVPNPSTENGLALQEALRQQDAALTVRETHEEINADGSLVKTVTMQDGSKQVITMNEKYTDPKYRSMFGEKPPVSNLQQVQSYDSSGKLISTVRTQTFDELMSDWEMGQRTQTVISVPGQGTVVIDRKSDGTVYGTFWDPEGSYKAIPADSPFFTHPMATTVGGAITGLETAAGKGALSTALSLDEASKIKAGSKFAGPALGMAVTAFDMATAETPREACVAGVGGAIGTGGSVLAGSLASAYVPGVATATGASVLASMFGSWVFGSIGNAIGEKVC